MALKIEYNRNRTGQNICTPGTSSKWSIQSGGDALNNLSWRAWTRSGFRAVSINPDLIPSHTNAFCGSEVMCQIDFCFSFGFWLWLQFGGWFGLRFWCGGFSSSSSLTFTKIIFIIGHFFGRCTNILRYFHRRHCLEGNKTVGAECRHGDIQVLKHRY